MSDRDFLVRHLEDSRDEFEAAIRGSAVEIWAVRPEPERWSVRECVEHVLIVEQRILASVDQLREAAAEPFDEAANAKKDEAILSIVRRDQPRQAPLLAQPSGRLENRDGGISEFRATRQRLQGIAEQYPAWLRGRFREHPLLGKLDGHQWLLAASCHSLRHADQVREIGSAWVLRRGGGNE